MIQEQDIVFLAIFSVEFDVLKSNRIGRLEVEEEANMWEAL